MPQDASAPASVNGDAIKLVIWDMDETFWKGILAEGGKIEPVQANIERVRELVNRGVMNSVSSKNREEDVLRELERLGVREYFVFPSIHFGPKGPSVKKILDDMSLRAPNTIFLDDNPTNLHEVQQFADGIYTMTAEEFQLLDISQWGKDDSELSRLRQYKQLEQKRKGETAFDGDHADFLRASGIVANLVLVRLGDEDADRIVELVNRTNQLNFFKSRIRGGVAQLSWEVNNSELACYKIFVKDAYGDHGLSGYAALAKGTPTNRLLHFTFSCRLLGMHVESAVLRSLQGLHGPVHEASELEALRHQMCDWVEVRMTTMEDASSRSETQKIRVLNLVRCLGVALGAFLPECSLSELPVAIPGGDAQEHMRTWGFSKAIQRVDWDVVFFSVNPFPTSWLLAGRTPDALLILAAALCNPSVKQVEGIPTQFRGCWCLGIVIRAYVKLALKIAPATNEHISCLRRFMAMVPASKLVVMFSMRDDEGAYRTLMEDENSIMYTAAQLDPSLKPETFSTAVRKCNGDIQKVQSEYPNLRFIDWQSIEQKYVPMGLPGHYSRKFYCEAAAVLRPLLSAHT